MADYGKRCEVCGDFRRPFKYTCRTCSYKEKLEFNIKYKCYFKSCHHIVLKGFILCETHYKQFAEKNKHRKRLLDLLKY